MMGLWRRKEKTKKQAEQSYRDRLDEINGLVERLIEENDELVGLYGKLGAAEDRRSELKSFLMDLVATWPRFTEQDPKFQTDPLRDLTHKYLKATWMHVPWVTDELVHGLILSTFGPLDREVRRVYIVRFLASVVSLGWFVGIYALFVLDWSLAAWLGVTLAVWYYTRGLFYKRSLLRRFAKTYDGLVIVSEKMNGLLAEIEKSSYSPSEAVRILRWVEDEVETVYVPTVVYSLLRLHRRA